MRIEKRSRKLRSLLLFAVLGGVAVATAASWALRTSGAETISTVTLSEAQLEGLGLNLRPLPQDARRTVISAERAKEVASDRASLGDEPEILHVVAEITPGDDRNVWLLLSPGGDADLPLGPFGGESKKSPDFTGVAIDDQTGEVVLVFYGGRQGP